MRKRTAEQKSDIKAIAARSDEDIDFSDALPVSGWSAAEVGKFYSTQKEAYNDAFGLRWNCPA